MVKRFLFLLLACAASLSAQGVRFSSTVTQQSTIGLTNVVTLPVAPQINFCNSPVNGVPCTNKATTYTSSTLATPCPLSTQIVLDGTTSCVASPDAQNNWGVWVAAGYYGYTITLANGVNLGPYYVSASLVLGTGGVTNPGAPFNSIQRNVLGVFTAANATDNGSLFSVNEDLAGGGPNPYADIRSPAYGGVLSNGLQPWIPGDTANCVSGNTQLNSVSFPSHFANGMGVTLWGCGATNTMSTPGTPVVTPSIAIGPTGTGMVANALAGGTSFQYQVIAFDKNGGHTATGPAGTTATGNTLGWQTQAINLCSKVLNIVTCNTTATHPLVVNIQTFIQNTTDSPNFGGVYTIATVPDNTHFTYKAVTDTRAGGSASATGGTVGWFNANHITWSDVPGSLFYVICGPTAGSNTPIGISKIQNRTGTTVITDPSWDDFGATMRGTPTLPAGLLPGTCPVSATNDWLTTTVASQGGTASPILTVAPSQSVTTTTILADNAPAFSAALAANGQVYIPAGLQTVLNSYIPPPANGFGAIYQQGTLTTNWLIELASNQQWYGNVAPATVSALSFANGGGMPVNCGSSLGCAFQPGIIGGVTLKMKGLTFNVQNNGYGLTIDNNSGTIVTDVNFAPPGTPEGMTMPVLVRNANFQQQWNNITFNASTTVNSTTPVFFCNACLSHFEVNIMNLAGRGVFFNGTYMTWKNGRKQGGPSPAIFRATLNGASAVGGVPGVFFAFDDEIKYELDTDPDPLVVGVGATTSLAALHLLHGGAFPSSDTGGPLPVISNNLYRTVHSSGGGVSGALNNVLLEDVAGSYGTLANCHPTYGCFSASGYLGIFAPNMNVNIGAGYGLTIPFTTIPVPTAAVTTTGCTTIPPANTYTYQLAVVGPDNVQSGLGLKSNAIVLNGTTQCGALTWTDTPGVIGYKVYANGGEIAQGTCNSFGSIVQANSCTDIHTFLNQGGNNLLNGTGNPSCYPGGCFMNKLVLSSAAGGNYGTSTETGNFTGSRTVARPDGAGGIPVTASLTTTAAASDNVAIQGATVSSHCTMTPTNANAATDSTATFVSAKTTNQITVTHPANAGRTWDISCTPN